MHVVLPELDGRILAGAVSFKDAGGRDERVGLALQVNRAEPDRVAQVARRIAAFLRMQALPRRERRVAVLIPDYPAAAGRTGYAVGLDVPASVLAILADLRAAGYAVEGVPETARELMRLLAEASRPGLAPGSGRPAPRATHGPPAGRPLPSSRDGAGLALEDVSRGGAGGCAGGGGGGLGAGGGGRGGRGLPASGRCGSAT